MSMVVCNDIICISLANVGQVYIQVFNLVMITVTADGLAPSGARYLAWSDHWRLQTSYIYNENAHTWKDCLYIEMGARLSEAD